MNWRTLFIILFTLSWGSCANLYRELIMAQTPTDLAGQLVDLGYLELFLRYDDQTLNGVWNQPNAPAELANLVMDSSASSQARFLAAEILFYKDKSYPSDAAKPTLAQIYATALVENYTGIANPWGLPGYLDSVGEHVVDLGDAAVPALVPLLDDETPLLYGGSQEATLGNSYGYRVKDMAAFFISRIKGIAYTVYQTAAERDAEIENLKTKLS
jgi:hypothetical protein